MHSSRQEKHKVLIKLSRKDFLLGIFYRIAHSTSWNLIQLLKSHSKEIWQWEALQVNATGGSSSLMEMNAVDQWQLRLLCSIIGHLGVLICFITDHLRDTVKTFHRAGLLWSYGYDSVLLDHWVMLTLDGTQYPGSWLRKCLEPSPNQPC